jgi:hypothetical protein
VTCVKGGGGFIVAVDAVDGMMTLRAFRTKD